MPLPPNPCSVHPGVAKSATKTRVDLSVTLKSTPATCCLIDAGGFARKGCIVHRIPVSTLADIGDGVRRRLSGAYEKNA